MNFINFLLQRTFCIPPDWRNDVEGGVWGAGQRMMFARKMFAIQMWLFFGGIWKINCISVARVDTAKTSRAFFMVQLCLEKRTKVSNADLGFIISSEMFPLHLVKCCFRDRHNFPKTIRYLWGEKKGLLWVGEIGFLKLAPTNDEVIWQSWTLFCEIV